MLTSKFTNYQDLIEVYFSFGKDDIGEDVKTLTAQIAGSAEVDDREKEFRTKLIAAGLKEEKLAEDLFEVAKGAPGCFQNPYAFYKAFRKVHP